VACKLLLEFGSAGGAIDGPDPDFRVMRAGCQQCTIVRERNGPHKSCVACKYLTAQIPPALPARNILDNW